MNAANSLSSLVIAQVSTYRPDFFTRPEPEQKLPYPRVAAPGERTGTTVVEAFSPSEHHRCPQRLLFGINDEYYVNPA